MKMIVELNGMNENPWYLFGLTQNPFPQTAKAELDRACLHLQALGGDPIPDVEYIRRHLKGYSQEFIDLCCERFRQGELVSFEVEWKD